MSLGHGISGDSLVQLIDQYAQASYGSTQGQLATERALAIARYNSEPYGDEIDGRSQLVSSEIRDTVETVVPQLMRIFLGGDMICEFDPEDKNDVDQAKKESKFVNWSITQRNAAFQVFGTWFRDALLCKNGYVKAWWEERSDIRIEHYRGMPDDAFQILMQDADVEVTHHTAYPDPAAPQPAPLPQAMAQAGQMSGLPMLHDAEVRRKRTRGYVRFDNCPGEEILVHSSTRGPDLRDCIYAEHRSDKTLSEIRQMGYDVPDDWAGTMEDDRQGLEGQARDRFNDLRALMDDSSDPAARRATFREVWIRVDEDGDGIAELRKVCMVNRRIVNDEETDLIPLACITPVIQPHRHVGYGYYDFLRDIEAATTAMLRAYFDNVYLANNGRYGVNVQNVNVDDLLISRPGGIVRVKGNPSENIFPITHPVMGESAGAAMQFLSQWKKNATGVVGDAESLSADVLNNSTATGISQAISVWQARVEGVARCFAETGMTDLFRIVHALTQKNATAEDKAKIGGEWVTVDPREWVKRTSLTVTVGLGTGSKEAKLAFLQQVAAGQQAGLQIGIAKPQNLYETALEMMKEGGFKDGARFWTDPRQEQPQPPKDDPLVEAEKIKAQKDMMLADKKAQTDQAQAQRDAQTKVQIAQIQADIDYRAKVEIANLEIAAKERMHQMSLMHAPQPLDGQHFGARG